MHITFTICCWDLPVLCYSAPQPACSSEQGPRHLTPKSTFATKRNWPLQTAQSPVPLGDYEANLPSSLFSWPPILAEKFLPPRYVCKQASPTMHWVIFQGKDSLGETVTFHGWTTPPCGKPLCCSCLSFRLSQKSWRGEPSNLLPARGGSP